MKNQFSFQRDKDIRSIHKKNTKEGKLQNRAVKAQVDNKLFTAPLWGKKKVKQKLKSKFFS